MSIKGAVVSILLCSLVPAASAESRSLAGETRERLVAALGKPLNEGEIAVFRKERWEFKVHFERDRASRVKVSRADRAVLSDQEIRRFLPPIHGYANWEVWSATSRRAWIFKGGKHPTYYCVVAEDSRSLLLVCPMGADTPPDLSEF